MKFDSMAVPTVAGLVLFSLHIRLSTLAILMAGFFPLMLDRAYSLVHMERRSGHA